MQYYDQSRDSYMEEVKSVKFELPQHSYIPLCIVVVCVNQQTSLPSCSVMDALLNSNLGPLTVVSVMPDCNVVH